MSSFRKKAFSIKDEDVKDVLPYVRVSSTRQEIDGSGLDSQETRCRNYCVQNNFKVEKVFRDTYSGGGDFMNRPGMRALIEYIDAHPHKRFIVLFDDLKRFARDTEFHLKLRTAFRSREVILKCLNFNFDESPEGQFVETVLAGANELERQQNRRQVIQKMKACFDDGYRPFPAFPGYTKMKVAGHKHKVDVPNEQAPMVKEALEGFAEMRFLTKTDVGRFLQEQRLFSGKQPYEKVLGAVTRMLTNPFPAGFVEYKKWDVPLTKGAHEPIISWETYVAIQKRLEGKNFSFIRKTIRDELELRGLVVCADCGKAMTGATTTNKKEGNKHIYYKCQTKKGICSVGGKSVRAEKIHSDFYAILHEMSAKPQVVNLTLEIFDDVWKNEIALRQKENSNLLTRQTEIEDTISKLAERIAKTTSEVLIEQYEKQIEKLSTELKEVCAFDNDFDLKVPNRTAQDEVVQVLKNPYPVWENYTVAQKRRFFTFLFEANLIYDRNFGYRTPEYALPISLFEQKPMNDPLFVLPPGIEPGSQIPQTCILSIKLWERTPKKAHVAYIKIQKVPVSS